MALELKQQLRLSQQLVMTPQLQQAIKLLQLSRMELVDLVQQEMQENPVLEEGIESDGGARRGRGGRGRRAEAPTRSRRPRSSRSPSVARDARRARATEADRRREDRRRRLGELPRRRNPQHRHAASAATATSCPSLEATSRAARRSPTTSLWQLQLARLHGASSEIAALRSSATSTSDGYLQRSPLEEIARQLRRARGGRASSALAKVQDFDPTRRRRARPARVPADPGARARASTTRSSLRIVDEHLDALEKRDFRGDRARRSSVPLEEVAAARGVIGRLRAAPGPRVRRRRAALHHPRRLRPQGRRRVPRRAQRRRPAASCGSARSTARCSRRATRRRRTPRTTSRTSCGRRMWLIRSIHQRQRTIYKVSRVDHQVPARVLRAGHRTT